LASDVLMDTLEPGLEIGVPKTSNQAHAGSNVVASAHPAVVPNAGRTTAPPRALAISAATGREGLPNNPGWILIARLLDGMDATVANFANAYNRAERGELD